jgi:hypothetical protein
LLWIAERRQITKGSVGKKRVKEGHGNRRQNRNEAVAINKSPFCGVDKVVSTEIHIVGPNGEKVDVMTFRGAFERDLKDFAQKSPDFQQAVENEDDDAVETILNEQFFHRPDGITRPINWAPVIPAPLRGLCHAWEKLLMKELSTHH